MINSKHVYRFGLIASLCFITVLCPAKSPGHEKGEEILLELEVERTLTFDITGYLLGEKLYLPATELFSFLKIKANYKPDQSNIQVFFPHSNNPVRFDFQDKIAKGPGYSTKLKNEDILNIEDEIYILKNRLEQIFDFEIVFDFRNLKVMLFSKYELPVIQSYKRKQRYSNFEDPSRKLTPEVAIPGKHYLINGWVADWSLNTTHNLNSFDYSYGLGLGGHLLGGDLSLYGRGSKQYGIHWSQIRGRWRYPIYSSSVVKQVLFGDLTQENLLGGGHIPFLGATITNQPKAPRHTFSTFTLADRLREGWDTELYINRQFADYAIGSRMDRYRFTTPLQYGSNLIQLKYYDPDGFSSQQQYLIYIPQEFLPPGKFEYALTAGRYTNFANQDFARLNMKWGAFSFLTMGGGTHYAPDEADGHLIPFVQSWLRLGSRIIVEGSHTYNYLTQGSFRMFFPGSQSLLIDLKKYHQPSDFNITRKSLEASLNTSFPVRILFLDLSAFLSSRYIQDQFKNRYLNFYGGITSSLPWRMRLHLNSRIFLRNNGLQKLTHHNTEISLYKRIFRRLLLRPSVEYNHIFGRISNSQLEMSLRVHRSSYLNVSYRRNHTLDQNRFLISFKLDLPFARHTSSVRTNQYDHDYYQSTSGTIVFDNHRNLFHFDNRSWLGKATLTLDPFLDLNDNSYKDAGEPFVKGMGATVYKEGDHLPSYRNEQLVTNLVPYDHYLVRVNETGLQNPLWIPKHKTYSMQVVPNTFNTLPVPVTVAGEVSGNVFTASEDKAIQLYDLNIQISTLDGDFQKVVKTFSEGSFYYVGLKPGTYMASLDQNQLSSRSLEAVYDSVRFTVKPTKQGDIVEGITLKVRSIGEQPVKPISQVFVVQIGAFAKRHNAASLARFTGMITDHVVTIIYNEKENLYKCQIGLLKDRQAAETIIHELQQKRNDLFWDAFVIELPVKPQKMK